MDDKKHFRSLIEELSDYAPDRPLQRDLFVESRAMQAVAAVNNLRRLIKETYGPEEAEDLLKRLGNSIKTGDDQKFRRGIRNIMETRKK